MHSKISLGSLSSLRSKCRFLDLKIYVLFFFPPTIAGTERQRIWGTRMDFLVQGKREQEGLHECAGSAQGCAFPHVSVSATRCSPRRWAPWAHGRPPISQPYSPRCRRGLPGPPFHPSLLQEGCTDFHQKIQLRVDHRNKSFIKGTRDSEPYSHSRHRGRSGGAATWRWSQSPEGGRPTPRAPLSALMQTPHPLQNNYQFGGSQGLGWERAPTIMVTVFLVLLERVLGPSVEGSRGSPHRPQSQQCPQVSPASPTSTHRLPDFPQLPSS